MTGTLFAVVVVGSMGSPYIFGKIYMQDHQNHTRRNLIKYGLAALAIIPVVAMAAKNDPMRASTKYKDTPEGDKQCSGCAQFVPGASAKDAGGCKIFPGDTEVSPTGYCIAWSKKA